MTVKTERLIMINTWLFAGVGLVLRQRLRRNTRRNLLCAVSLLAILLGVSGLFAVQASSPEALNYPDSSHFRAEALWAGTVFALYSMPSILARCMILYACGASVALMPLAGLLGAQAAPRAAEAPAVQEALLTRLRPGEICLGRLLAGLWPLLSAAGLSGVFWLLLQSGPLALPEQQNRMSGFQQILSVHCILMSAVFMAGSLGYLFASRLQPGALWGRGAGIALALSALFITGIVLVNPLVQRLKNPVPLIDAVLLLNPIAGVASALKLDLLRTAWLYEHTDAHHYPFAYPMPFMTAGLFLAIGLVSLRISAKLLQYAYRK